VGYNALPEDTVAGRLTRMDIRSFRFLSLGLTLALFGAVDLVVTLFTPGWHHTWLLVPPIVAAIAVLVGFPYAIAFFQAQQDRIATQVRELETLHAMDTAIVSEMDLERVLIVAVQRVMRAVDAVAGGIVLIDAATGSETEISVQTPDHQGAAADAFTEILRRGGGADPLWEAAVYPVRGATEAVSGFLAAARARPCTPFSPSDRALLSALSGTVAVAVSNAYALRAAHHAARVIAEAERVRADLERERRVAQALTEGLLPEIAPRIGRFCFSKRYQAQSDEAQVGGDIYDLFPLGRNRWGIVIADVSGKGLAAAQKTAMVKYSLRSYAREHESPAQVLCLLNDTLTDEEYFTGFVTLFYGLLDIETGEMTYASAGHEPPVLRRADGVFENLRPTGMVLGAMRDMPYEDEPVRFENGDGLLLYTDGLTEARSAEAGEFLMIEGVERMLTELGVGVPSELAHRLWDRVEAYTGGRQLDDTALVWLTCEDTAE
jgi:serine phosphatase RsbU (regulator of sigma subunit)